MPARIPAIRHTSPSSRFSESTPHNGRFNSPTGVTNTTSPRASTSNPATTPTISEAQHVRSVPEGLADTEASVFAGIVGTTRWDDSEWDDTEPKPTTLGAAALSELETSLTSLMSTLAISENKVVPDGVKTLPRAALKGQHVCTWYIKAFQSSLAGLLLESALEYEASQGILTARLRNTRDLIQEGRLALSKQRRLDVQELRAAAERFADELESRVEALEERFCLPIYVDNRRFFDPPRLNVLAAPVQLAVTLVLVSRLFGSAARNAISFMLKTLILFGRSLIALGQVSSPSLAQEAALEQIPVTLAAVEHMLDLDIPTTCYAVCPRCHCTYEPFKTAGNGLSSYPQVCTEQPFPYSPVCNTPLLLDGKPVKTFHYFPYEVWFGQFIARPEVTTMSEEFYERATRPQPEVMTDFADGSFVRMFPGPTPNTFFLAGRGNEYRFFYSLNVDFFNIEGNLQRGAKRSMGVITMHCLNLPGHVRIDPSFVYVPGVIPGVEEPLATLSAIRHYLKPVIGSFVAAYERGIWVAQTPLHAEGQLARSALAFVVADVKAARSAAGLADINAHHLCVQCILFGQGNILSTDFNAFLQADCSHYRNMAEEWWTQPTQHAQDKHFEDHGVRGSEFWKLPYWNPVTQLVVDPMHSPARMMQQYARDALRLDKSDEDRPLGKESKDRKVPESPFAFLYPFEMPPKKTHLTPVAQEPQEVEPDSGPLGNDIDDDPMILDPDDEPWQSPIHQLPTALTSEQAQTRQADLGRLVSSMDRTACKDVLLIHQWLQKPCTDGNRDAFLAYLTKSLSRRRLQALQYVCADLACTPLVRGRHTRVIYAEALVQWRSKLPFSALEWATFSRSGARHRVQRAIQEVVTPSWIGSLPHDFGERKAGTMKAYQWRLLWNIYIPLAMLSLWAPGSPIAVEEGRPMGDVLANVLHFAIAMTVMCRYSVTQASAQLYRTHLAAHMDGLRVLFPGFGVPSYHISLHIYDFLLSLGPVRSWWCYPFERLIGKLQRLLHNHKYGQLEETLLRTWWKASLFRQWLGRSDVPAPIQLAYDIFRKVFGEKSSDDTEHVETEHFAHPPSTELQALLGSAVKCALRIEHNRVFLTGCDTHEGNSLIMVQPEDSLLGKYPARISQIFKRDHSSQVYLAIHRQQRLPRQCPDLCHSFPDYPCQTFSSMYSSTIEIVPLEQVTGHYARWSIRVYCSLVLDLSRI